MHGNRWRGIEDPARLPNWGPPTHALQIFDYVGDGSIRVLWIIGTNPAVSIPDLNRLRADLCGDSVFVIVQDAFMTETAEMADVVLPAAIWDEKTGCSTNVDRVVHLNKKAIERPGEARSDLEIFLDFAHRMDFRDREGAPLIKWADPEGAFNAWRECSRGRPCDYSGFTYAKLTGDSVFPGHATPSIRMVRNDTMLTSTLRPIRIIARATDMTC